MNRGVIILRNTGHGVNDIFWFVLPSLLPVILEQFDMKYGTAGGLLTAFIGVIAIFSFILGKISDHLPRHYILGTGFLVASVFLIGSSFMDNLSLFVVCILFAGIGVSSFHPAIYAFIEDTTKKSRGIVYGMFEFWGAVAILLMFLLHGFLLKQLSWRTILIFTSIPGLIMGSLYFIYSDRFKITTGQRVDVNGGVLGTHNFSILLFVLFLVIIIFRYLGIIAVVHFTPTYLVREIGLPANIASYATGLYFVGGLIFTPIIGKQCDIRSPFLILLVTTGIAFPLIFLISLPHPLWILPLYLILLGGSYYGAGPSVNMIIAQVSSKMGRGEAFGYLTSMMAVAYSFSPLLFGLMADRIGLRLSIRFFSFPLLISTALLFLLFNRVRKDKRELHSSPVLKPDRASGGETY